MENLKIACVVIVITALLLLSSVYNKKKEAATPIVPQLVHFKMEDSATAIVKVTTREEIDAIGRWYLSVVKPPSEQYLDVLLTNGQAVRLPRSRTTTVTVSVD